MKPFVISAIALTLLAAILWPEDESVKRANWARTKYLEYCSSENLPMRTVDTNGANAGGGANLCYDESGIVERRVSGRCWFRPNLIVIDRRTNVDLSFTHPDCMSQ